MNQLSICKNSEVELTNTTKWINKCKNILKIYVIYN